MHMVVIPPGAEAGPHVHEGYETAMYVIQGQVETTYGPGLRERAVNRPGKFLSIPLDLPRPTILPHPTALSAGRLRRRAHPVAGHAGIDLA